VRADKDVVVLRTFSKLYGMAGLRCGCAIARPDLLEKINNYGGWNFMPITAMVAATASLKHTGLIAERKKINASIREETFQWLERNGYSYVRSESNCFMLDTKRPAKEIIDAMATQKVFIGRIWPAWPTYTRITVGTRPEMEQFQAAFKKAMSGAVTAKVARTTPQRRDGIQFPA
jgi:histidinol-phosphate/aromatic aminotransferase/cobyric acid decarboxylase-like protein